jgi:type IV pilus assembly protein PilB
MSGRKRLGEMLVEAGVIDPAGLSAALAHHRQWGVRLGQALVELRIATEKDIVGALSRKLGLEATDVAALSGRDLEAPMKLLPREYATKHNLLPIADDGTVVTVAMSDPVNVTIIDEIAFKTGRKVKVTIAGDREIAEAVRRHYGVPNPRIESIALVEDPSDTGVMSLVGQEKIADEDEAEWRNREARLQRHEPDHLLPPEPDERTARHDLLGSVPAAGFDLEKPGEVSLDDADGILEPLPVLEPELEPAPPPGPPPAAEEPGNVALPSAAAAAVAAVAARGSGDPVLADAARVLSAVLRLLVRKGVLTDAEITAELRRRTPPPGRKR